MYNAEAKRFRLLAYVNNGASFDVEILHSMLFSAGPSTFLDVSSANKNSKAFSVWHLQPYVDSEVVKLGV